MSLELQGRLGREIPEPDTSMLGFEWYQVSAWKVGTGSKSPNAIPDPKTLDPQNPMIPKTLNPKALNPQTPNPKTLNPKALNRKTLNPKIAKPYLKGSWDLVIG